MTDITKADNLLDLLSDDKVKELRKVEGYLSVVNSEPRNDWIKNHPLVKRDGVPLPYLPIERCEWLMTKLFEDVEYEVLREGIMANSVYVAARVWYTNPVTGKRLHQDGVGAIDIQTQKGAAPTDFTKIISGALNRNLPTAESYARKNAMQKIGKIFGGRLDYDIETAASNMFVNIQDSRLRATKASLGSHEGDRQDEQ